MTDFPKEIPVENIIVCEDKNEVILQANGESYTVTNSDFVSLGVGGCVDLEKLTFAAEKLSCIKKAENYLSYNDLSKRKLREKLKKHFGDEVIEAVISLLEDKGYINDQSLSERLAVNLAEKRRFGKARIKAFLYEKGFSTEDIKSALDSVDEEKLTENLEYFIRTEGRKYNLSDRKSKAKFINYLYRLGYSWDEIKHALNEYSPDEE